MRERSEEIARIAVLEQGKTLAEARMEVGMNVGLFEFYAGECYRLYGRVLVRPAGMRSTAQHEPVGPVAAFAPWNFPIGNPAASWARPSRRAAR
jgi:succinate-semialdehyde dehydrogenase/glutarate-semialdehyde dehydrogenase